MNIYSRTAIWKALLLVALLFIVSSSILYTTFLAKKLQVEEKKKMQLLADVYKRLNTSSENSGETDFEVIQSNETIPVILADENDHINFMRNVSAEDSSRCATDSVFRKNLVEDFKHANTPIKIEFSPGNYNFIYYRDSYLLTELRYFPYIQFAIIFIFLLVAYLAFSSSRRSEQNRVWVGMAKETAHQLGTPLSSLAGWVEYLTDKIPADVKEKVLPEMEKDLVRLSTVTERFSKIGSEPHFETRDIKELVEENVNYIKRRASEKVEFIVDSPDLTPVTAPVSPTLFSWVIENLLKNALDAMEGNGTIHILITMKGQHAIIDVVDTGKGITGNKFKEVFKPGYSTKKRGWGLGLSLSKRIIENYHKGKIMVKESVAGKGTTFRIMLRK